MRPGLNALMGPTGSGKTTYVYSYVFTCTHVSRATYLVMSHNSYKLYHLSLALEQCYSYFIRLLDVLADRKGKKGPSGIIVVNGQKRPKNFNCVSGYVVQVSSYVNSNTTSIVCNDV